jgi:hypothetical protein
MQCIRTRQRTCAHEKAIADLLRAVARAERPFQHPGALVISSSTLR